MRARRAIKVGNQHFGDIEGEVQPDQIGLLHRPKHRRARAETFLDHGVDGLGIADAGGDQRDRLALHGMLQAIADEARNVAAHVDRDFSGTAQQVHRRAHHGVAGLFVLDDFDQRHQMRRIPEMRADDALAVFEIAADVGRGNGRAVAGEDRLRRDRAFKIGENLLLQRQLFRRRFEHERRALNRRRKLHRSVSIRCSNAESSPKSATMACRRFGKELRISAIGSNRPTGCPAAANR